MHLEYEVPNQPSLFYCNVGNQNLQHPAWSTLFLLFYIALVQSKMDHLLWGGKKKITSTVKNKTKNMKLSFKDS